MLTSWRKIQWRASCACCYLSSYYDCCYSGSCSVACPRVGPESGREEREDVEPLRGEEAYDALPSRTGEGGSAYGVVVAFPCEEDLCYLFREEASTSCEASCAEVVEEDAGKEEERSCSHRTHH